MSEAAAKAFITDPAGSTSAQDVRDAIGVIYTDLAGSPLTATLGAGASTISVGSIPATASDLLVMAEIRSNRAGQATDNVRMRVGNTTVDTGSNYSAIWEWTGSGSAASRTGSDTSIQCGVIPGATADAGVFGFVVAHILGYSQTTRHRMITGEGATILDASQFMNIFRGRWENTAAPIDIISFIPQDGTQLVAGSTMRVYLL